MENRYKIIITRDDDIIDEKYLGTTSFPDAKQTAKILAFQDNSTDVYLVDTALREPLMYWTCGKIAKITSIERIFAKALCAMEVM